jgi:DNA polymerase-3 subunit delta
MMVTLTGSNDFLRQQELKSLVAGFLQEHDEMAIERFDGDEADAARMREALNSLPFLTTRKLVILREPGRQKTFAENIGDILKDVADTTDLIVVEPKLDKRLAYYKTLKKDTDFREFGELDANGLAAWATGYAKEHGGSLKASDAKLIVDRLGANQQLLKSELDKLLAYNDDITRESIDALVDPLPQSTVFELLDAAFQGKTDRALQLYHEQRTLKVEPQAIIALLAWQLHVLAVIKAAGTRSPDEIAREAKLNPFVVRKSQGLARALSLEQLRAKIDSLLTLDIKLKKVSIDADEALQLYLMQLANR